MFQDPEGASGLFIKYNYAETKDLAKAFITLSSGVLAFSVAYAEKVVNYQNARIVSKVAMISSWLFNIMSIICCGAAICFISLAGGAAVYGGDFDESARTSYLLLLVAGATFVTSLIALVLAGSITLIRGPEVASRDSHGAEKNSG